MFGSISVNFFIIGGGIIAFLSNGIFGNGANDDDKPSMSLQESAEESKSMHTCRNGPHYEPTGHEFKIHDFKVYESGDMNTKRLLIVVYDIFGYHPNNNTKQFADMLAKKERAVIAMPDFFRGCPWDSADFPPKDPQKFKDWLAKHGSWNVVGPDIEKVISHYKEKGFTFGIVGFCWGGKVAMQANAELKDIRASASIHPANVGQAEADCVISPVLLLPSKNEPDMIPFQKSIQKRLGGKYFAVHHRFDDMNHGFAATRGDYTDETNCKRVRHAISLTSRFMKLYLPLA